MTTTNQQPAQERHNHEGATMYNELNAHRLPRAEACGQIAGGAAMQAAKQYRPDVLAQGEVGRAEPARDASEVERELSRLDAAVSGLHKLAAELVERLRPVSAPRPEGAGCNSAEPRAGSPLGAMVQDQRNGVLAAAARIREVIDSLAI